jgi:hypothetical protein
LFGSISNLIYWLLILLLGAIGYWLQASPKAEIAARRRLREWRKTGGTVTGARLEEIRGARLSVPDRLLKTKGDVYKPVVSYTYPVGDKTYTCSKYRNSFLARGEEWMSANRQSVDKIVAAHPPGQPVIVNYDPEDPADAFLELDSSISQLFVFRTSGIVLILAASLLFIRSAYSASGDLLATRSSHDSAAVFPVTTSEIRAGLSSDLNLVCTYSGIYRETYESWLCKNPPSGGPALVYIYSRKLDLEKTDYLIAKALQPEAPVFFTDVLGVAYPQFDPLPLQDWIAKTAPTLSQRHPSAQTIINRLHFVLSSPAENTLQLDVGEFKN